MSRRRRLSAPLEELEKRQLLAAITYLSDLPAAPGGINGWGVMERDRSNGELGPADGHIITLNGATFTKGLGVHALSDQSWNVVAGIGYNSFQATVGVDDEVGNNGSVVFQVWVGDVKRYDSGVMTGASVSQAVNVDITGFTGRVRLVVTDAGNGKNYDHADWAGARLVSDANPLVSLTRTSSGDINENGGTAGFLFSRQSGLSGALDVNFTTGGNATRGADYELHLGGADGPLITGNALTIPDGSASVQVTAVAINDSILDPGENIILSVAVGSGYQLGFPSSNSLNILDDEGSASALKYLSDLPIVSSINGWGPVEKDRSNGETGASDGNPIRLDGITYAKGLGVHANSEIVYNLTGGYDTFNAVIGVDDEVGNNGSVIFQVFADGVKVYDSGVRTGAQPAIPISVNIAGATQLKLVVTNAGDGNAFDHADWADARIIASTATDADYDLTIADRSVIEVSEGGSERFIIALNPRQPNTGALSFDYETYDITATAGEDYVPRSGHIDVPAGTQFYTTYDIYVQTLRDNIVDPREKIGLRIKNVVGSARVLTGSSSIGIYSNPVYVSDLTPVSQTNGWGPVENNMSNGETGANDGKPISLNGNTNFSAGLGVHANSDILYDIAPVKASTFSAYIGVDDEVGNNGSVVFQVFVDGVKKYDSGLMTGSSATKQISLDVAGASTLRLVVTDGGNGNAYDHADWAGGLLS
jgi:hypothetical protein